MGKAREPHPCLAPLRSWRNFGGLIGRSLTHRTASFNLSSTQQASTTASLTLLPVSRTRERERERKKMSNAARQYPALDLKKDRDFLYRM